VSTDPILSAARPIDSVESQAQDLTAHPTILATIEASYQHEAEIALATFAVGAIDRALSLAGPAGLTARHVLFGTPLPAVEPGSPAPTQQQQCQLQQLLQSRLPGLIQQFRARLGR